jgi:hypothetical protein
METDEVSSEHGPPTYLKIFLLLSWKPWDGLGFFMSTFFPVARAETDRTDACYFYLQYLDSKKILFKNIVKFEG